MTLPLFLLDAPGPLPAVGGSLRLAGAEGRHAAVVRRIEPGERIMVGDGVGSAVTGAVAGADKHGLTLTVEQRMRVQAPAVRYVVAQALAKGDRGELACELVTELGASAVLPWSAQRSQVRWTGERGEKALGRWRSTVREATKQSRRLWVPEVTEPRRDLATDVRSADLAVILHEEATRPLRDVVLPATGTVLLVVGPEGGIAPEELSSLTEAGGLPVGLGAGVLRTSTAGAAALAGLTLR